MFAVCSLFGHKLKEAVYECYCDFGTRREEYNSKGGQGGEYHTLYYCTRCPKMTCIARQEFGVPHD